MKKLSIFFIIHYSLLIANCVSQWVQQTSGVTSSLLDIDFINQNTGWACGDGGVILKTTNGGVNWIQQPSGVFKRLEGIDAVDANIVYCVGWFQTILKSTNGGDNWLIIRDGPSGTGSTFFKTYFINANTGWLLRSSGYVLRTINGGSSFDSTFVPNAFMRDLFFKDANTGVLCADGAFVAKSTDGGVTWNQIILPLGFEAPNFYRISFVNNLGWTIGNSTNLNNLGPQVFKTSDFGSTWDTVGRVLYPNNEENYSVFFSSLNTGYAGGTNGYLYKSTNGGFNWIQQVIIGGGFRRDFYFVTDSIGWVVGGGGQIFKTTNGGTYVSIIPSSNIIPKEFKLYQNYPNPFNASTKIKFDIAIETKVTVRVYDLFGREIAVLVNELKQPGYYEVIFNGTNIASGVYFYTITAGAYFDTKKMVLIK